MADEREEEEREHHERQPILIQKAGEPRAPLKLRLSVDSCARALPAVRSASAVLLAPWAPRTSCAEERSLERDTESLVWDSRLSVLGNNILDSRAATFGTFNENRRTGELERFLTPLTARSVKLVVRRRFTAGGHSDQPR